MKYRLPLFLLLISCVTQPLPQEEKAYEKEFKANFEEVWRASQQAMISYPLKTNNMEQGQIQTSALRSHVYFKPPHEQKAHAGGHRYELTLNILKMTTKTTKVSIQKNLQIYRDFISRPESRISDGLEEEALLYRISREIEIDRAIIKESQKTKR